MTLEVQRNRLLAPLTTLWLGGPAKYFVEAYDRRTLVEALAWAQQRRERLAILGGGSNLVIRDAGFDGLVVRMATQGLGFERDGDEVVATVEAGVRWQDVVDGALEYDLAGIECLTGIPGSAGATPIQNVGAYGQEIGDVLESVDVLERATGKTFRLTREQCQFGYRTSRFKRDPGRFIVLALRLRLRPQGAPCLRYRQVSELFPGESSPSLRDVERGVHQLRAAKSMLVGGSDENRYSAGSFFTNPVVSYDDAWRVAELSVERGFLSRPEELPRFFAEGGGVKLAAGWLIEQAGISRGTRHGGVGISTKHALCLVHYGGGSSQELLALASQIRTTVWETFGVELTIEPVVW